jgi:hypothetical protein
LGDEFDVELISVFELNSRRVLDDDDDSLLIVVDI